MSFLNAQYGDDVINPNPNSYFQISNENDDSNNTADAYGNNVPGSGIRQNIGRGTDPIPSQSLVQITISYKSDLNIRGNSAKECLRDCYVGTVKNPTSTFSVQKGDYILQDITDFDTLPVSLNNHFGAPHPVGFASITNLRNNRKYKFIGVCGSTGSERGNPLTQNSKIPLGILHIFNTERCVQTGKEYIPVFTHVGLSLIPNVTTLSNGTVRSNSVLVGLGEDASERLVPQLIPLVSNKYSENLLMIIHEIDKQLSFFIHDLIDTTQKLPNWGNHFMNSMNYSRTASFYWYGIVNGAYNTYALLYRLYRVSSLSHGNKTGVYLRLLELSFIAVVEALKKFWRYYATSTCNVKSNYNNTIDVSNRYTSRFPSEIGQRFEFPSGENREIDLEYYNIRIQHWKQHTDIVLTDFAMVEFTHFYVGMTI